MPASTPTTCNDTRASSALRQSPEVQRSGGLPADKKSWESQSGISRETLREAYRVQRQALGAATRELAWISALAARLTHDGADVLCQRLHEFGPDYDPTEQDETLALRLAKLLWQLTELTDVAELGACPLDNRAALEQGGPIFERARRELWCDFITMSGGEVTLADQTLPPEAVTALFFMQQEVWAAAAEADRVRGELTEALTRWKKREGSALADVKARVAAGDEHSHQLHASIGHSEVYRDVRAEISAVLAGGEA